MAKRGPVKADGLPGEAVLRSLADPKVVERGRDVARSGAVADLVRRGDTLTAAVAGSADEPYRVTVHLEGGEVAEFRCTCPYEWGGACKHVVATLLAAAKPGAVAERPPLRELLDGLSREALTDLLLRRAGTDPDLPGWIEVELATAPGRGAVDPAPLAAQARTVLAHRARTYWDDYDSTGPSDELHALVEKAVPFLEAGDGRNALRVLEALAEPFIDEWLGEMAETDEEMYLLFEDLGRMMAEAVLLADLSEDERDSLFETVEGWQDSLGEYGPGEGFSLVTTVLATGWESPALRAALAGKAGADLPDAERDPRLIAVRLRALDAAGRTQDYLNFARVAGDHGAVAGMLVRLGRVDEAVAHAVQHGIAPGPALALARRLREGGQSEQALALARGSLRGEMDPDTPDLLGRRPALALARWLRDEAAALGHRDLAVEAARAAFAQSRTLPDYAAARAVAGPDWPALRDALLARLADAGRTPDRIAILLEESLVGDAIAAVESGAAGGTDDAVLHRLAEGGLAHDPAWVVRFAERKAEPLMEGGATALYEQAAAWLARARAAYMVQGRQDQWAATIDDLITAHKRRYKLKPLLEALR